MRRHNPSRMFGILSSDISPFWNTKSFSYFSTCGEVRWAARVPQQNGSKEAKSIRLGSLNTAAWEHLDRNETTVISSGCVFFFVFFYKWRHNTRDTSSRRITWEVIISEAAEVENLFFTAANSCRVPNRSDSTPVPARTDRRRQQGVMWSNTRHTEDGVGTAFLTIRGEGSEVSDRWNNRNRKRSLHKPKENREIFRKCLRHHHFYTIATNGWIYIHPLAGSKSWTRLFIFIKD